MKFTFRGVRGTIPVPGPSTLKYGGNTSCIEVRGDNGELLILDAGTGIFPLGQELLREMPIDGHLFISHTHWDHIQGLPLFVPIFIPGNKLHIYGAADPVSQRGIRDVLSRQMEFAYFPVREAELAATLEYTTLREGDRVDLGDIKVHTLLTNHPVMNLCYKIECNGKRLAFTGDHEWPYNIYEPGDDYYEEFEEILKEKRQDLIGFLHGIDALIIDTSYTEEEYAAKQGWGHGTFDSSIRAAREAGVKHVYLTHHEPTRSDDELERVYAEALARAQLGAGDPQCSLAREGMTVEL